MNTKFLQKEKVHVPQEILDKMMVLIPPIYYWENVEKGKSVLMTMAFQWQGMNFGHSFPLEGKENDNKKSVLRNQLFAIVKETLDVLLHHGEKVLDKDGNIDFAKVQDEEAIRFRFDPLWVKKVAAFNQLVRVAPITKKRAVELGLLDKARTKK